MDIFGRDTSSDFQSESGAELLHSRHTFRRFRSGTKMEAQGTTDAVILCRTQSDGMQAAPLEIMESILFSTDAM